MYTSQLEHFLQNLEEHHNYMFLVEQSASFLLQISLSIFLGLRGVLFHCMYMCTIMYVHVHVRMYVYVYVYVCMYVYMYVCMYMYVCVYVCMYVKSF